MAAMTLGYPDFDSELSMAMAVGKEGGVERIKPVLDGKTLQEMQEAVHEIYIREEVYRYLLGLVTATRELAYVERGASPRATIALVKMAKAAAWLEGRAYVTPGDVISQYAYVVSHRLLLNAEARMENVSKKDIIGMILEKTPRPPMGERGR